MSESLSNHFTKTLVYTLFSWTILLPRARKLHFPSVYQKYLRWMSWKHDFCRLFFLLHENASVYLVFLNVFYSFSVHTNAAFSKRFHTELLTVKAMKTCCSSIIFLLYGNRSEQLAPFTWMFFRSFRERTSAAFSKRFHTELLTVNVKKTWYSSIISLLHGNANE